MFGLPRTLDPRDLGDHLDRLFRAAWAMTGSREDAEDLVQETYERVLRKPRILRNEDDLGYLLRTMRNTQANRLRTLSRRPQTAAMPDDPPFAEPRPMVQPDAAVEARELFATIAGLSDDFREALVAVDVAGLSYGEAAKALRTREATITTRVYRARKKVAETLGDRLV
jgi:RNA polymerase sigma-70 factor, ECF subfamily